MKLKLLYKCVMFLSLYKNKVKVCVCMFMWKKSSCIVLYMKANWRL